MNFPDVIAEPTLKNFSGEVVWLVGSFRASGSVTGSSESSFSFSQQLQLLRVL